MIPRATERKRRLEAAFDAGSAERRNRPTGLIVLAVVLLVAAVAFWVFTLAQRQSSQSRYRAAQASMQSLVDLQAEIELFQNNDAQRELRRRYAPVMRTIRSRLETLARRAGVTDPLPQLGQISSERRLGLDSKLLLRTIDATIAEGDHANVLEWLQSATTEIDGLFVSGISLTPVQTGWRMNIKLSRWEIDQ